MSVRSEPQPGRNGTEWPLVQRLVCVSANPAIDKIAQVGRLVPGEIHRAEVLSMLPGGKAVNVARAATRLRMPASVVAVLAGHAGEWIAEQLAARGIIVRRVSASGETRTCLSVLDSQTGSLTEFYEAGVALDAPAWDELEAAVAAEVQHAPTGALVVLSGSLPPGSPVDGYRRLAVAAGSSGSPVAVDVGGAQLRAALAAGPWLVKVNATEAGEAVGVGVDGKQMASIAARALRDAGAAVAIVTMGPAGAVVESAGGTWRVSPAPARGAFGVGSGDAFLAGLAASLAAGLDLPEAARRATAVGVAHSLVPGQGEFDPATADALLPRITLEVVR